MTAPLKTKLKAKPLMRYHGGKWQLSKWIISHFPEHKTYVSDIYTENLPGWHCVRRKAYASGAKPRLECLFIKPAKDTPLPLFEGGKS